MTGFRAHLTGAGYGALDIIADIRLEVARGEMLVILGSNGSGKTTTLGATIGTVRCRQRRIALDDTDLSDLPSWALPACGVMLVPDGARCFPNLTIIENLQGTFQAVHGRRAAGGTFAVSLDEVYGLFPILAEKARQAAGSLSGGQRQMLAIGRAIMADPQVLLLDEPSAGLAPKLVEELFAALARIKAERGWSIVMAEQNVWYAEQLADRCLVLEEARVVLAGPMADICNDERLSAAYLGM